MCRYIFCLQSVDKVGVGDLDELSESELEELEDELLKDEDEDDLRCGIVFIGSSSSLSLVEISLSYSGTRLRRKLLFVRFGDLFSIPGAFESGAVKCCHSKKTVSNG